MEPMMQSAGLDSRSRAVSEHFDYKSGRKAYITPVVEYYVMVRCVQGKLAAKEQFSFLVLDTCDLLYIL
jgi:hypothetical protein